MENVALKVGGSTITGWTEVRVTRGLEQTPSDFEIAATVKGPGGTGQTVGGAGDACTLQFNGDTVLTGYVDAVVETGDAESHELRITGRGKCQDLVDCSAQWPTGQMVQGDALNITSQIGQAYGVSASLSPGAAAGDPITPFALIYGESAMELIERVVRNAGLLAYEGTDGNLILGHAGNRAAASGLVYGQNVQSYSVRRSMNERYRDIVCEMLSTDVFMGIQGQDVPPAKVTDPNVPRPRLLYLVADNSPDDVQGTFLKKRATWESARRAGRSVQVNALVDSWRDAAGALWMPNSLVAVTLPQLGGIDLKPQPRAGLPTATLCLASVTFSLRYPGGTTAEMMLMPIDAFLPQPIELQPANLNGIAQVDASAQ